MMDNEIVGLLRAILAQQTEQNALLTSFVKRQSMDTNAEWRNMNPELSSRCGEVTAKAAKIMDQMLEQLVDEMEQMEPGDSYDGGDYQVEEFVTKYGNKFQQFNMILNVLSQLGNK